MNCNRRNILNTYTKKKNPKLSYFTVRSLKGCSNKPKGSLALFSKACVCGIFVNVHRNELKGKKRYVEKGILEDIKNIVLTPDFKEF